MKKKSFTSTPEGKKPIYHPGTVRAETIRESVFRRKAYADRYDNRKKAA